MVRSTTAGDSCPRVRAVVLALLMVTSATVGLVTFAGAAAGQSDATAAFEGDSNLEVPVGDPMRQPFQIIMDNAGGNVTVVFSPRNSQNVSFDFWANVTLQDTDGNGAINLTINTWELGHSRPFYAESGEVVRYDQDQLDDDTTVPRTESDTPYELYLATGNDPAGTLQSHSDTARLNVDEAETAGWDPATAPRSFEFDDMSDLYVRPDAFSNLRDGLSAEGDRIVAQGDKILLMPWGGGYFGVAEHAMARSESPEEAMLWILENDYWHFNVTQMNSQTEPKELDIEHAVENGGIQFASGTDYYHIAFVINTSAPIWQVGGTGPHVSAKPGDQYKVSFQKGKRADPEYGPKVIEMNFSVVERSLSVQSPVVSLENGELAGETTLAPGTELSLYIEGEDDTWIYNTTVDIRPGLRDDHPKAGFESHSWNRTVDLGGVDSSTVQLTVLGDDLTILGAFPPGFQASNLPDEGVKTPTPTTASETTTSGDGETTTTAADGTTTAPAESTTDPGDGGDGGDGGLIPGFTASIALLALIAAALLAMRRS